MAFQVPSLTTQRRWLVTVLGLGLAPMLGYLAVMTPKLALAGCIAMSVGVVLLARPLWAVYMLVVGSAFDAVNVSAGFALFGMGDLACFALIPVWLAHRLLSLEKLRLPIGAQYLAGYAVLCAASMLLGVEPARGYTTYVRTLVCIAALFAVVDLVRDEDVLARVLVVVALCSLIHAVIGLVMPAAGNGRIGGLEAQPNLLGARIAIGLFPMAGLYLRVRNSVWRFLIGVSVVTMAFAIVLTISRGTYLGLLAGILFWLRRRPKLMFLLAAIGSLTLVSLDRIAGDRVDRIERRLEFQGSSVINRGQVAKNALMAVSTSPLFGVGFGQFSQLDDVIEITAEAGRGGHSFYLSTAASAGLPALLAFLLFGYGQFRQFGVSRRLIFEMEAHGTTSHISQQRLWILDVFQAMSVFHGCHLIVRGSQRWLDWLMFALYAASALAIKLQLERPAATDTRSISLKTR